MRNWVTLFATCLLTAASPLIAGTISTEDPVESLYDASLIAYVVPPASGTTVWFEWGLDTNYGNLTPSFSVGASAETVSNLVSDLTPYTTYHCQAISSNALGLAYGGDVAFTTVPRFIQMGTNADWGSLVISSDGTSLAASQGGVIYISTNLGASFLPTNQVGAPIGISSDGSTIIVENGNRICVSKNYGATWRTYLSPVVFLDSAVSSYNASVIVGADGGSFAYTSTNYGASWTAAALPYNATTSLCLSADGSIMYGGKSVLAGTDSEDYVYASTNSGVSWPLSWTFGDNIGFGNVSCSGDGQTVFMTGEFSEESANGGGSWDVTLPFMDGAFTAVSGDGQTFVGVGESPTLVSPNGGAAWYRPNFSDSSARFFCVSGDGNILAAIDGIIYLSVPSVSASLQVNIMPPEAVAGGARWRMSSSIEEKSGVRVPNLKPGSRPISFKPISGWNPPSTIITNVVAGQTTVVTATYLQQTGSVLVNLAPSSAAGDGARWQLDNSTPLPSGQVLADVIVGQHTLHFTSVSNWIAPPDLTIVITNAVTNVVNVNYLPADAVQVLLQPPAAVSAGASWSLAGGSPQASGAEVVGLTPDSYVIIFTQIPGFETPPSIQFNAAQGQTNVFTATYVEEVGSVRVFLDPPLAIGDGAKWQADGGPFFASGSTVSGLKPGSHILHFSDAKGWITPSAITVQIVNDQLTTVTNSYVPAGSLQVNLSPPGAVAAGAGWRVDGGLVQNSGAIVPNLASGSHSLTFAFASGWTAPAAQTISVASNVVETASGVYTPAHLLTNLNQTTLTTALAAGGTVQFAASGTILLTNPIVISNETAIDGGDYKVVLNGGSNSQIFIVNSNASLLLNNLSLENGFVSCPTLTGPQGGGAISNNGSLSILGCVFRSDTALGQIPGITDVFYLTSPAQGGAVFNAGLLFASNAFFIANSASGGIGAPGSGINGGLIGAGGEGSGGAIYNLGNAAFVACTFVSNNAVGGFGGAAAPLSGYSGGPGGAGFGGAVCSAGVLSLSGSTFLQNSVTGGAGNLGSAGRAYYDDVPYPGFPGGNGGGGASGNGGAVCSVSGSVSIITSTFVSNSATGGFGGNGGPGGSTGFEAGSGSDGGNGASGGAGIGGAICSSGGLGSLTNLTLTGNFSIGGVAGLGGAGGGGFRGSSGSSGYSGVSGLAMGDSIAALGGTILVKNTILSCAAPQANAFGTIIDAGYNINSDPTGFFTNPASFNYVNPLLGDLGDYGGPTQTIPLLPGSRAIDAADPTAFPPTDQRGFPRPSGPGPDIGAFEYTYFDLARPQNSSDSIQFALTGSAGNSYVLQVSLDLINWSSISTNSISSNGSVILSAPIDLSHPQQYYRAVKQ